MDTAIYKQSLPGHGVFEGRVEGLDGVVGGGERGHDVVGFVLTHVCLHDKVSSRPPPLGPVLGSWEF